VDYQVQMRVIHSGIGLHPERNIAQWAAQT
jgi:hypothetical protein